MRKVKIYRTECSVLRVLCRWRICIRKANRNYIPQALLVHINLFKNIRIMCVGNFYFTSESRNFADHVDAKQHNLYSDGLIIASLLLRCQIPT